MINVSCLGVPHKAFRPQASIAPTSVQTAPHLYYRPPAPTSRRRWFLTGFSRRHSPLRRRRCEGSSRRPGTARRHSGSRRDGPTSAYQSPRVAMPARGPRAERGRQGQCPRPEAVATVASAEGGRIRSRKDPSTGGTWRLAAAFRIATAGSCKAAADLRGTRNSSGAGIRITFG